MYRAMFKILILVFASLPLNEGSVCGCKSMRPCYVDMLNTLRDKDEEACIENVAIGASTLMIYLKALKQFCGEIVTVNEKYLTYEGRHLYEVAITESGVQKIDEDSKPIIILESGLLGKPQATFLTLVLIQQMVACVEYTDMIDRVKWIILPASNPDGLEYARYNHIPWSKNMRPSEDHMSLGVDLTRNFDSHWSGCGTVTTGFSQHYPGTGPFSENETMFVRDVLQKYKKQAKAYVSILNTGHSLLYPYAFQDTKLSDKEKIVKYSVEIANKVNQRAGAIQLFVNDSIFTMNGRSRCGSSVDYAYGLGIPYCYEMRVFLGPEAHVLHKFQSPPRGYFNSLTLGYLSGIKRLFDLVVAECEQTRSGLLF